MALQQLGSVPAALSWLVQRGARGLVTDSRKLMAGDAFIAWPGHAQDGRAHVSPALASGAAACVVEADGAEALGFDDERIATMDNLKAATGPLASAFFGAPSDRLTVVAVTGTNGKTSTAWWTAQALSALGARCGVIGTLGVGEVSAHDDSRPATAALVPTGLTTPDPVTLQRAFKRFADNGFAACAIEASSIGLAEQRLSGTHIDVAVLTNVTQDHLDFHGSMDAYWQAKLSLFGWPGLRAAVVNLDDARGTALASTLAGSALDVWTYTATAPAGKAQAARLGARKVGYQGGGLAFEVVEVGEPAVSLRTGLIGDFNVANLLAVVASLRALGHTLADAAQACATLSPVPGRMQRVQHGVTQASADSPAQPEVLIDYAHTPDALDKALRALQPLVAARGGALWCVFGCGGGRDAGKRPLMGAIAQRLAQHVVVTSDNPRHEVPADIINAIVGGMAAVPKPMVIEDRRAAIAHALSHCGINDVILIAGKGHEDYQEVAGVRLPFDDATVVTEVMRATPSPLWGEGVKWSPLSGGEGITPMMTLAQAHALLPHSRVIGDGETPIQRVHSDTRTLRPGDLFVALEGERFDAHDFLPQARACGAVAALAERGLAEAALPGLEVPDTRTALGLLAAGWRRRFDLPLIAVSGSNGKTTVTQMIAAILRAWQGDGAFATEGNFNNDIGVPLTLLRLRDATHRAAVVELGMNHPGEIAQLAAMAAPTVALVNNAQREHQEFMTSVEAVARENGAVIGALGPDGTAVFPADDAHTPLWRGLAGARRVTTFALGGDARADVWGDAQWHTDGWQVMLHTPVGRTSLRLRVAGLHNVKNALAASACALAAGCPLAAVASGLEAFTAVKGRSQASTIERHGQRVTLIDDSYNANPDSVRAAIAVLADLPGPRWLVLGDMGEVGDQGPAFHREVGAYARSAGIEALWTAGALCAHAAAAFGSARHFDTVEAMLAALLEAPAAASVLVKGSRFMKMERVVAALMPPPSTASAGGHHAA